MQNEKAAEACPDFPGGLQRFFFFVSFISRVIIHCLDYQSLLKEAVLIILKNKIRRAATIVAERSLVLKPRCIAAKSLFQILGSAERADSRRIPVTVIHFPVFLVIRKFLVIPSPEAGGRVVQFFFCHAPSAVCHVYVSS